MYTSSTQRQGLSLLRIKICQSNNTAVRVQYNIIATRVVAVTCKLEVYIIIYIQLRDNCFFVIEQLFFELEHFAILPPVGFHETEITIESTRTTLDPFVFLVALIIANPDRYHCFFREVVFGLAGWLSVTFCYSIAIWRNFYLEDDSIPIKSSTTTKTSAKTA
jgi:hypothetical protein